MGGPAVTAEDSAAPKAEDKLKVFISYSRKDKAFTRQLVLALEARGLAVTIDERDLPTLEDWRRELLHFIRAADTVVFVVTPNSIASPVCAWEIQQVVALNKRLAPVVLDRVPDDKIPESITQINYLFFDPPNDFETQADKLATALLTDSDWLREHTRLTMLAERWIASGQPPAQLLRTEEIDKASRFAAERPRNAPPVPELLLQFLEVARKHEQEARDRQRRIIGRAFVKPALEAQRNGLSDHALRLAASGTLLVNDLAASLVPELWSPAAQAMFNGRTRAVLLNGTAHPVLISKLSPGGARTVTASLSPDGSRIVTSSGDAFAARTTENTAGIWEATTGRRVASLEGHGGVINSATFNPDGTLALTASADKTARIWVVETGVETARLVGHDGTVCAASFSPQGTRIITASHDNTARLWETVTGRQIAVLTGHEGRVENASFSPDGTRIATASGDNTVRMWDTATGRQNHKLDGYNAVFSPDGTRLLIVSRDRTTARLLDVATGQGLVDLKGHTSRINSASFSSDGKHIVTSSTDQTARVWDAATGRQSALLAGHRSTVLRASFSSDCTRVVTAS